MLLSIITVSLNNLHGLKNTVASVFAQRDDNFEYIVIDGGSIDGTRSFIRERHEKFTYWCSEPDRGIYDAMNKGAKIAKGKYLLFLNSGDTLAEPDSVSKLKALLYKADFDILYGAINLVDQDNTLLKFMDYPQQADLTFFSRNSLCHQSTLIKRSTLAEASFYKTEYHLAADWHICLWALKHQKTFKHIDNLIFANYLVGGKSSDSKRLRKEKLQIINQFFPFWASLIEYKNKPLTIWGRIIRKQRLLFSKLDFLERKRQQNAYQQYVNTIQQFLSHQ